MLHLKNENHIPKDASELLHQSREFCSGMNVTIRDTRVSRKFLEFDVSIKKENLDELLLKMKPLGELDHAKHVVEEEIPKDAPNLLRQSREFSAGIMSRFAILEFPENF